jgi:hypothetical protein
MTLIRVLMFCLLMPAALAGAGDVPAVEEQDWQAIRSVITAQLEAFRRDDADTAYSFAAPEIRALYPTAGEFMLMVRVGYRAVYRPLETRFLKSMLVGGQPVQPLQILTADNELTVAWYLMRRQPDGSWKIGGCSIKGAPGTPI